MSKGKIQLLDYGAGNVRSLRNAINKLGYEIEDIKTSQQILSADVIVFPGVGSFGQAMKSIDDHGWREALIDYINAGRPFFGICLGMQSLFEGSDETPNVKGLGIIPGRVTRFNNEKNLRIPHIGWNGVSCVQTDDIQDCPVLNKINNNDTLYFVHSFCVKPTDANSEWALTTTDYGTQRFISMIQKGNVVACQFHPEKSGEVGLSIINSFLSQYSNASSTALSSLTRICNASKTTLVKRIVACLDVRENDDGDLVVTKGDQYDVRENNNNNNNSSSSSSSSGSKGEVRNLGKPVALCTRYYDEGADEVVFLNITSFRKDVLDDMPMLRVLEKSSEQVFVPLTVGGGIRGYTDSNGVTCSALDVAARYFRAGADKVSIGGDAVAAAEELLCTNQLTGQTSIEQISNHYGAQAVVVSIDPKRIYCDSPNPSDAPEGVTVVHLSDDVDSSVNNKYCWWQCTIKGGREVRPIDAVQLAQCVERLGAGELMINCIDMDGQKKGYDLELMNAVQNAVTIPVIASSGAGAVEHFSHAFNETNVPAALAAGIFHRNEVKLQDVKKHLNDVGIPVRQV